MPNFFLFAIFAAAFFACDPVESEPKIVLGHEWNATAQVVADTTSVFKPNDIIVIQMDNGNKPFKAVEVELRVYQGETNRILFKRSTHVKNTEAKVTIKGPDSEPLTARKLLRTATPGPYRIAFAIGDSILLEKNLELVSPN